MPLIVAQRVVLLCTCVYNLLIANDKLTLMMTDLLDTQTRPTILNCLHTKRYIGQTDT